VSLKKLNTHNFGISRLPLGSLGKNFIKRSKIYYKEKGGIFLSNVGHVNVMN